MERYMIRRLNCHRHTRHRSDNSPTRSKLVTCNNNITAEYDTHFFPKKDVMVPFWGVVAVGVLPRALCGVVAAGVAPTVDRVPVCWATIAAGGGDSGTRDIVVPASSSSSMTTTSDASAHSARGSVRCQRGSRVRVVCKWGWVHKADLRLWRCRHELPVTYE